MHFQDEEAWFLEKIYKNSAIQRRYSILPQIIHSKEDAFIGISTRNALFRKEAPVLAEKSAREAIQNWGQPLDKITHVISVSCTGVMTPGIEFILSQQLGLRSDVTLLGINFMGCHGAFKALKVAEKIAKHHPKNRILLVCTELCSLHFKARGDIETIVIQSLFADGSAAVIMGSHPSNGEKVLFEITNEHSLTIPSSQEEMTWHVSDEGFDMTLSQRVPHLIGNHIEPFVEQLLRSSGVQQNACEWAVHPGGKMIIETVESALSLNHTHTTSSWKILQQCGNLSSATFLFVLQDISQRKILNETIVGLGFGPGLTVEGLLLKKPLET